MYVKCGSLVEVEEIFDSITEKNVVIWNVMINGYLKYGLVVKVLECFNRMENVGIKLDGSIFTSIFFVCNYVGFVDEGYAKFFFMESQYGILFMIEYYGCLVGLFGRVGRLKVVEMVINQMLFLLDVVIWDILFGVCRVYGNVDFVEMVVDKVL